MLFRGGNVDCVNLRGDSPSPVSIIKLTIGDRTGSRFLAVLDEQISTVLVDDVEVLIPKIPEYPVPAVTGKRFLVLCCQHV